MSLNENMQPLRIEDMHFQRFLGEGQFGEVWLASRISSSCNEQELIPPHSTSSIMAVKVLSKYNLIADGGQNEAIHNLKREIDVLHEIKSSRIHPCLVQVIETIQDANLIYIAQEFCGGGELFSLIQRRKKEQMFVNKLVAPQQQQLQQQQQQQIARSKTLITSPELFYAACIADALHHLHSRGIIYRDLKPENIVIRHTTGYPVLIDFGYAKHLGNTNQQMLKMKEVECSPPFEFCRRGSVSSKCSSSHDCISEDITWHVLDETDAVPRLSMSTCSSMGTTSIHQRRRSSNIERQWYHHLPQQLNGTNHTNKSYFSCHSNMDHTDIECNECDDTFAVDDDYDLFSEDPKGNYCPDAYTLSEERREQEDQIDCRKMNQANRCYSMVGTPKYVAPEIILGEGYDYRADLWAYGVVLYELLAGYNPMEGPAADSSSSTKMDDMELYRCITEEDYVPLPTNITSKHEDAADLIKQLLVRDPEERIHSSRCVLDHEWFHDVDFDLLRKQELVAPWIPSMDGKNNNENNNAATASIVVTNDEALSVSKDEVSSDCVIFLDCCDPLEPDTRKSSSSIFQSSYPKLTSKENALFASLNSTARCTH